MKKTVRVVGAIILSEADEVLCALRSPEMSLPNYWEFPGGKIEVGESIQEAVIREIKEETGLTIFHPRLVGVKQFYDHNHERYLVFFYIADKFTGTVKASDEGTLTWMTKDELEQHKLAYNFDHDLPVFFDPNVSEHMLDGKRDELF